MHRPLPILFALLLAAPATAQEPITVRGKTASIIRLESKATGEVGWILDERLESDERSYRDLAAKRLIVVPPVAGRYVCHAFSVESGKPTVQKFVVIAEGGPPGPGPGPDPVETIASKLAAAFSEDKAAGAGTDADKISLGKLYRILADQTNHAAIANVFDAHAARRAVVNSVFGAKLPKTVEAADFYCREKLGGAPSTALTQPMRDALKGAMLEIAAALIGDAPPVPVPVPVPVGVRDVYIVRETADTTPELARLIVSLRAGAPAKYIKDKGHSLTIIDKDSIGPDKLPAPIVVKLRPHFEGMALPVLIVLDKAGALVSKQPLPASADGVMEAVKKAGG